jgi:hypothetical protein
MNEPIQRASSSLQTKRAQFGAVFVVVKHVAPTFFGDPKTAAMKVLGG